MKKYVFFTAIGMSLFLTSCSTDDVLPSERANGNISIIQEIGSANALNDSLNIAPGTSLPPKTIGRDD